MKGSIREILQSGSSELGFSLEDCQFDRFDRFTELLLEWNSKFNLTRITDPDEIAVKHYLDSLSLAAVANLPSGSTLIDVGTGAGFPGIPLKIAFPRLKITMLDSVRKKLTFLETVVRELNFSEIELIHGRAEEFGKDNRYRENFDFSVSRAVARLNALSELCMPFCRVGGKFIAYKGADVEAEIAEAENSISILGGRLEGLRKFALPQMDIQRALVVIEKIKPTPSRYPRKPGTPERNPL